MKSALKQGYPPPKAFTSSLALIATSYALRCDAKFADINALEIERRIRKAGSFRLGELLPLPFIKGVQHSYLDQSTVDSVPVVNTLAIQNLSIQVSNCRHIALEDYEDLSEERSLMKNDVLLTVDGGVSIGKPVVFKEAGPFTVDSHIVILRPKGISALALVYLLASPLDQMQFLRAESGASGQTTVTEDDIRRFIFPKAVFKSIELVAKRIEDERTQITKERMALDHREAALWKELENLSA